MSILKGFCPIVEAEVEFTGKQLLQLLLASRKHYDSACQAASARADGRGQMNGLIITTMMRNRDYCRDDGEQDDADWLWSHPDATFKCVMSFRELDLLCKISESFSMMLKLPGVSELVGPRNDGFIADVAVDLRLQLNRTLRDIQEHQTLLAKQEAQRREDDA